MGIFVKLMIHVIATSACVWTIYTTKPTDHFLKCLHTISEELWSPFGDSIDSLDVGV